MNFKPTLLKTIISILGGVITFFYIAGSVHCDSTNGCIEAVWIRPLYSAILLMVTVFVLWSLVQRWGEKSMAYIFLMIFSRPANFVKNKMKAISETRTTTNSESREITNVKSFLGDRPYWLKGIIVALSIYFISVLSLIISGILGGFYIFSFFSLFSVAPSFVIQVIIVNTFELSSTICGAVAFAYSCPFYIDVIAFIFTGILYLVSGVLLGWIIGKLKFSTVS